MRAITIERARRIALAAQGLDRPRPAKPNRGHLRRVIHRLGLLQIDFVNVLVPAHYQVPASRLGPYDRGLLDDLVYRRREFTEHWAHEASVVPVQTWPLLAYRRQEHRPRPWAFASFMRSHPEYMENALERVREGGAIGHDALDPAPDEDRTVRGVWYRSSRRAALEAHLGFGRLAVAGRRPNFARVYDLAERVIPAPVRAQRVEREEAHRRLLLQAARAHGIGTVGDLADYWRMPVRVARPRLDELVQAGELEPLRVEGWRETALRHPRARCPRRVGARALLSPFDPLVWCRPRTARLFGFDYRLEIFVPAKKRRWGYYVLPFLLGDRLVARVDLRADRAARTLRVEAAYREPDAAVETVVPALASELESWAEWLDLERVAVGRRGDLAAALRAAARR